MLTSSNQLINSRIFWKLDPPSTAFTISTAALSHGPWEFHQLSLSIPGPRTSETWPLKPSSSKPLDNKQATIWGITNKDWILETTPPFLTACSATFGCYALALKQFILLLIFAHGYNLHMSIHKIRISWKLKDISPTEESISHICFRFLVTGF